jgi:hypothetical protein
MARIESASDEKIDRSIAKQDGSSVRGGQFRRQKDQEVSMAQKNGKGGKGVKYVQPASGTGKKGPKAQSHITTFSSGKKRS